MSAANMMGSSGAHKVDEESDPAPAPACEGTDSVALWLQGAIDAVEEELKECRRDIYLSKATTTLIHRLAAGLVRKEVDEPAPTELYTMPEPGLPPLTAQDLAVDLDRRQKDWMCKLDEVERKMVGVLNDLESYRVPDSDDEKSVKDALVGFAERARSYRAARRENEARRIEISDSTVGLINWSKARGFSADKKDGESLH